MKKLYMRLRKNSFLLLILLSIFGMICIPLLAMQIVSISRASSALETKTKEFYDERITANANLFESQLSSLTSIAANIYLDESVNKLTSPNVSHYDRFLAAETIKKFSSGLLYVNYVGAYYPNEDFLLKDGYAYSLSKYCDSIAGGNQEMADDLINFFSSVSSISLFSSADPSGTDSMLILARPFSSPSSSARDVVIFFSLDVSRLGDVFTSTFPDDVNFAISAPEGQILMNCANDAAVKYSPADLLGILDGQIFPTLSNGSVCKYTSTEGYTYLAIISNSSIQDGLSSYVQSSRHILYLSVVISMIFLTAVVNIIYKPVKELVSRHISTRPAGHLSALELLDSELFSLDQRIATQSVLLSNFILDDLLFGYSVDPAILERHFPADKYSSFIVSIADCQPMNTSVSKAVSEMLEDELSLRVFITGTALLSQTVLVFMSNQPINTIGLKEHILLTMEQCAHPASSVVIGKPVDAVSLIRVSYHEAQLAHTPAAGPKDNAGYPSLIVQELLYAIDNGLVPRADEILSNLLAAFTSQSLSVGMQKVFCYRLLDNIIPQIQKTSAFQEADTERLLNFYSPDQMFTLLREIVARCCLETQNEIAVESSETKTRLIAYVDQNYRDQELCLAAVADHLNLSIYTVSRLFKEATAEGFKEYVTKKRLEYACALLKQTDKSISSIANESGFADSSHFSATFKRKYGTQPYMYRNGSAEEPDMPITKE